MKPFRLAFLFFFVMCSWCVYNFTVIIPVASTSQQPELPAACIARPNASQLMSQQVSVVYILLGQRKTYFKKFPVQDLEPEDRQLFAVEKAYRQAWEAAGVVSVMSEDATFVISKQQNPRLLDLCTEYPRHQIAGCSTTWASFSPSRSSHSWLQLRGASQPERNGAQKRSQA